ncbi:unnamed protein product [Periconia digitata]|uniref:Uncharacterized protein n=1 Tax=Periconia digitata TaxID=1303443 RepID=A0A9W4UBA4_9PLEO|nr:unnamed protein product [Periconia digitata]
MCIGHLEACSMIRSCTGCNSYHWMLMLRWNRFDVSQPSILATHSCSFPPSFFPPPSRSSTPSESLASPALLALAVPCSEVSSLPWSSLASVASLVRLAPATASPLSLESLASDASPAMGCFRARLVKRLKGALLLQFAACLPSFLEEFPASLPPPTPSLVLLVSLFSMLPCLCFFLPRPLERSFAGSPDPAKPGAFTALFSPVSPKP